MALNRSRGGGQSSKGTLETGAVFAKISVNASGAARSLRAARLLAKQFLAEFRKVFAAGGLRTAEISTKGFDAGIADLLEIYDQKTVRQKIKPIAEQIVEQSIAAPVPYDTGALSRSGFVMDGERDGEVIFGFNRKYASIQDLGGRKLPPKFYGSEIGPNYYFSRTVERAAPGVLALVGQAIQDDLKALSARRRRS